MSISWVSKNSLFCLYQLVFLILVVGCVIDSGPLFIHFLATFYASFTIAYVVVNRFSRKYLEKKLGLISRYINHNLSYKATFLRISGLVVFGIIVLFLVSHGLALLKLFGIDTMYEYAAIRQATTAGTGGTWSYFVSLLLKSVIPFLLVLLYLKKEKWLFLLLLFSGIFLALNTLIKTYLFALIVPVLIVMLLSKQFLKSFTMTVVLVSGIALLTILANPEVYKNEETNSSGRPAIEIIRSLTARSFLVPGKMVSKWFETVPDKVDHMHGQGYKTLAFLQGKPFINAPVTLYPEIFPEYAEKGLKGSANVASFMYDYVNFGILGLVVSGIILAIVLMGFEVLFNQSTLKIALNVWPVFMLSSSSLATLLLSGGWLLTAVLFLIFTHQFDNGRSEKS